MEKSICDITTEESPRSDLRNSGDRCKRNQYSVKSVALGSATRAGKKTCSEVGATISVTPRRSIRKMSAVSKRASPATTTCQETLKAEGKTEQIKLKENVTYNLSKYKRKTLDLENNTRNSSNAKYLSDVTSNGIKSLSPLNTAEMDVGLKAAHPVFAQSSIGHNISGSHSQSSNMRQKNSSFSNISLCEDKRQLDQWGLPQPVLEAYKNHGVTTMFEWQAECLLTDNVLDGRNLVFSAPTSAGKTLVAELLVLKRVVETRKKALFVLPFVSVAREKMYALQHLYQDAGIRVGGYMGSYNPPGGLAHLDVAVCTIEKGNGIINRLMEEDRLSDLGVMVVDELHMVGDSHRGYLLELMLTKLAYITRKAKSNSDESQVQIQLIGMSATLPNLDLLARWLDAALYCTDFRPVPLTEHIKVNNRILDKDLEVQREIPASLAALAPDDSDHIIALCLETVTDGNAVLIFCPTKNWCEKLCETIAKKFYSLKHQQQQAAKSSTDMQQEEEISDGCLDRFKLAETVEQLRRCPVGIDPMLSRCILNGVAYHHAGLTFDERDIIEGAFRQGQIKVLIATSTLSSGVNLPARRVIVRTPMFHGNVIDTLTYKQMAGRAGRKGVDTQGESILICKPQEKSKGKTLLQAELPSVESCLHFDPDEGLSRSLKRAVLEVVVSGVAPSPEDVMTYVNCTLLSASMNSESAQGNNSSVLIESCIQFLQDNEFVTIQKSTNEDGEEVSRFHPTLLGSAILASSLSPDEGLSVFTELQKARRAFALDTDLHIIYLVTPMYASDSSASLDWCHYYTLWEALTPADRRVAEMVGVSEAFIARAINGRRLNGKTEAQRRQLHVHLRFYTALILFNLVREVPLMEVAHKFNYNKGQLQSLQQSAATYAGMITVLCGRLGWHSLELLLSSFQHRLSSGVQPELVDLVRVAALSATSARMLYNAGYKTVAQLARAKAVDLENLFRTSVPFQSDKQQEGETAWEAKERQRARCIWLTGRKGVTELEAAEVIIQEAKDIVEGDLGGAAISWETEEDGEEEEEKEEGECGEDHDLSRIDLQQQKGNQNLDEDGNRKLSVGINKTEPHVISPDKSVRISCRKESGNKDPQEDYCATSSAKSAKLINDPPRSSTSVSTNPDMETAKKYNVKEKKKRLSSQHESEIGSSRRRLSKSLDGSICSSLTQNRSLSSGRRSNRKTFFGQTVLSPPAGIVRGTPKYSDDKHKSLLNDGEGDTQCKTDSDKRKKRLSFGNNSVENIIISPLSKTADNTLPSNLVEKDKPLDGKLHSFEKKSAKSEECSISDKPHSEREYPQMSVVSENNSPEVLKTLSNTKNNEENEFSFSASFDLNSQISNLINSNSKSQKYPIETKTSIVSGKECNLIVNKSKCKTKDTNDKEPKQDNIVKNTKNFSFDDSFSEVLFDETNKLNLPLEVLSSKDTKVTGKTKEVLQYVLDEDEICEDVAENLNQEDSINISIGEEKEDGDEEEEIEEGSSLIAASNRFDHFDEGMIENESFESFDVSFTQLKTVTCGLSNKIGSLGSKSVLNGGNINDPPHLSGENKLYSEDLRKTQTEEDENLLLAALDLSLSFEASPFSCSKGSHSKNEPQNSTPVESFVNVLTNQPSAATPTSHTVLGGRNLRQKRKLCEGMPDNSQRSGLVLKNTQSNLAISQSAAEEFFADSFSLTLMDKIAMECDNLQTGKIAGCDNTYADQSESARERTREETDDLESANSSRHDGSDCVPPTPPDVSTSHASPMKISFYSPLKPKPLKYGSNSPKPLIHKNSTKPLEAKLTQKNRGAEKLLSPVISRKLDVHQKKNGHDPDNPLPHPSLLLDQPASACIPASQCHFPPSPMASQLTQQSFSIIDVCADRRLFESFISEWQTQTAFSLSVACEKLPLQAEKSAPQTATIGQKFTKTPAPELCKSRQTGIAVPDSTQMVVGLAVSWENRDVYFISLMPAGYAAECDPNDSLSEPGIDDRLSQRERVSTITEFLNSNQAAKSQKIIAYDAKAVYITLAKSVGVTLATCEDPRVADWIQEPTARLKNLHHMVASFCPEELSLLDAVGGASSYGSIGLDMAHGSASKTSGRLRACTESVLTRVLMDRHYRTRLAEEGLLEAFTEVEMPSLLTLARMELNGFGVCEAEIESQKTLMTTKLTALEERAYEMAGHTFSLTSLDDISKILYSELKLPINGDPSLEPRLSNGRGRGGRRGCRSGSALMGSTSKEVLEKLTKFHPLPALILEWRRISSALTKSLFALQRTARHCLRLNMPRVFGDCQIFTATGRVSMAEPNIQNIPKDFAIELPGYRVMLNDEPSILNYFLHPTGGVLLAADYSQLELRVIAHLSGDSKLAAVLNAKDGDVFKMIAGQMHSIEAGEVSPAQRQQAKQVCYGMLYGIGPKALGEQLGVDENDAGAFMEMFKSRFPGVRKYLRETVEFCQKNGYVKTMFNRRRFLPSIKHNNPHARAHAERQAVNTTVQGSAADLVKQAMVDIDRRLGQLFPDSKRSHSQSTAAGGQLGKTCIPPRGAFLVLQLHDELVYETSQDVLPQVAALVKASMEGAVQMAVEMPVKLKVGPSWGELQDWDIT
ncbi:hypothetical protein EGW08_008371 [Elysia chlorotica]|uniref:DNA polymerase theta n=1 Tax=Elysia chlorotica TaxID=188477 RepID=A0A433TQU5_ELYCH|nr:hypothetical protein EGW08_008371 [Elysia chlorotica]